jgi:hypothetical protein
VMIELKLTPANRLSSGFFTAKHIVTLESRLLLLFRTALVFP